MYPQPLENTNVSTCDFHVCARAGLQAQNADGNTQNEQIYPQIYSPNDPPTNPTEKPLENTYGDRSNFHVCVRAGLRKHNADSSDASVAILAGSYSKDEAVNRTPSYSNNETAAPETPSIAELQQSHPNSSLTPHFQPVAHANNAATYLPHLPHLPLAAASRPPREYKWARSVQAARGEPTATEAAKGYAPAAGQDVATSVGEALRRLPGGDFPEEVCALESHRIGRVQSPKRQPCARGIQHTSNLDSQASEGRTAVEFSMTLEGGDAVEFSPAANCDQIECCEVGNAAQIRPTHLFEVSSGSSENTESLGGSDEVCMGENVGLD